MSKKEAISTPRKSKKAEVVIEGYVTIGSKQLLPSALDESRREQLSKQFDDIIEAHVAIDGGIADPVAAKIKELPTLSVGFIARAMGLNLSNDQVLSLVEMVEERDTVSRGCVPVGPLKEIIVGALMSGVITRQDSVAPTSNRKKRHSVSENRPLMHVSRDSEELIYAAFRTLDVGNRGYMEAEELRHLFRSGLEPFTDEEMENMIAAAADPQNGLIFYEDFVDVLANE